MRIEITDSNREDVVEVFEDFLRAISDNSLNRISTALTLSDNKIAVEVESQEDVPEGAVILGYTTTEDGKREFGPLPYSEKAIFRSALNLLLQDDGQLLVYVSD